MLQFAQKLRNNGTPSNIPQRHATCYVGSCLQVSFLHSLPMAHKSNQSNLDSWPNNSTSWLKKWSEWRGHLPLFTCSPCAIVFKSCKTSSNVQELSKMEQRPRTSSGRRLERHCPLHNHLPNTPAQKNLPTLPASLHVFFQPCHHASIHLQTPTGVCSRCFARRMRLEPRQQAPNPVFAATVNI